MASGLLMMIDDIAALMDDMATMSKVAAKKTAGILGDDLAVNAEKASGFVSHREIPVLWAITKGSLLNKVIILPIAFLLSAFVPVVITVILLLGGLFLAYEGAEKVYEYVVPHNKAAKTDRSSQLSKEEILELEKKKIKSAVLTDFILSIEIVIITLGTVVESPIGVQIGVVSAIALLATVGVYGIVALIVRMDDLGYSLIDLNEEKNSFSDKVGRTLVRALPLVIKGLGILGTIALFMVSGGIFAHNIDFFHHLMPSLPGIAKEMLIGLVLGFVVLVIVMILKKMLVRRRNE
ncbi:MAG: DUF808 domain-containing protein [Cyclobacteriaceae bacterium]